MSTSTATTPPPSADTARQATIDKEPVGVVGCITPWNFPLMQAVNKVAPALAAGCTIVLKPSPLASITTVLLGELSIEAGVPAGVVNIVTGGPPTGPSESCIHNLCTCAHVHKSHRHHHHHTIPTTTIRYFESENHPTASNVWLFGNDGRC